MTVASTDRIEKKIVLRAPIARAWRALTDAKEFGTWFRIHLESAFVAGQKTQGRLAFSGLEHILVEMWVERLEAPRFFSFRWHPYPMDPKTDYAKEPTTLVEFELDETAEGTLLKVVESGFDRIPAHRRAEAFRMNEGGWAEQMESIQRYVAGK